jgi:peptide chain release factor 1
VNFDQKLNQVLAHFDELRERLSSSMEDPSAFARYSKEYADLTPIAEKILEWRHMSEEE